MDIDTRLIALERVASSLNEQMKVLKSMVNSQLSEMKQFLHHNLAEVKQLMLQQDKIYAERVRRMEQRIEQLSDFSLHLARAKAVGTVGGVVVAPGLAAVTVPSTPGGAQLAFSSANVSDSGPSQSTSGIVNNTSGGGATKSLASLTVEDIIKAHSARIEASFRYFSSIHAGMQASPRLRPTMDAAQFAKFLKTCRLCGITAPGETLAPAELIWMDLLQHLPPPEGSHPSVRSDPSTRELTLRDFMACLPILAESRYLARKGHLAPVQRLELLLLTDIFPNVPTGTADVKGLGRGPLETIPSTAAGKALTAQSAKVRPIHSNDLPDTARYTGAEVSKVLKQFRSHLSAAYHTHSQRAVPHGHTRGVDHGLSVAAFVSLMREHNVLPVVPKSSLMDFFAGVVASEGSVQPQTNQAAEPTLQYGGFVRLLFAVAEHAYGDALTAEKYPQPADRLNKLLTKMFLL